MLELNILEILYIVLIIFSTIIGVLLTIALIKAIKILKRVESLTEFIDSAKKIISFYENIPDLVLKKVKTFAGGFFSKKK